VRVYKDQPVPRELLERLARVVGFAPGSPHDRVGWVRSMIFVTGKDNMRRVAEFTVQYVRAVNKLLGSAMLGTFSRWSEMLQGARRIVPDCRMRLAEWEEGRDALIYDAPAAVFFHAPRNAVEPQADCDAALLTFALAAHAHGLGTCWNGLLNKAASGYKARKLKGLRKLIGMPDANDCYAAATIGYPAIKLHSLPHREVDARFVGW
jgi:nitroreductase